MPTSTMPTSTTPTPTAQQLEARLLTKYLALASLVTTSPSTGKLAVLSSEGQSIASRYTTFRTGLSLKQFFWPICVSDTFVEEMPNLPIFKATFEELSFSSTIFVGITVLVDWKFLKNSHPNLSEIYVMRATIMQKMFFLLV